MDLLQKKKGTGDSIGLLLPVSLLYFLAWKERAVVER